MKPGMLKTACWVLGLFLTLGFTVASCDDDDEEDNNTLQYRNLTLTGAKEVPANQSPNTGTINASYNKDTNVLTYTVTWSGFDANNMHFHKGEPTVSGPPVLPIDPPYTSPKTGTFTLTDAQEVDLLAGLLYINIHSPAFPGGEIRVQMIAN